MYWSTVIVISCFKLLLLPAYHSTDFEVHRNWLALTHSLPFHQWYYEKTSEWTLDYPPLFAWFEWILSKVAALFDIQMLEVTNLNYASPMTVLFQRLSVIVTDLVFAYAAKLCSSQVGQICNGKQRSDISWQLFTLLVTNAGLLLVDHIHFQYNGFLYGVMFLSIAKLIKGQELEGAFWFSILLNLKHIYLYIAPAYFVYLLRSYCLQSNSKGQVEIRGLSIIRLLKLGSVVITVFAASFGPFIFKGQLTQVLTRLFPFKRGLSHAYWAPNFWTLYNIVDKVLHKAGTWLGLVSGGVATASMTGGLVQEYQHLVLPSVTPAATAVCTLVAMIPCLVSLWCRPNDPWQFVRAVVLCSFASFMFGWHVHEKAILLIILPLGLLCLQEKAEAKIFIILSITGHFSLFPLLFTLHETPIKVCVLLFHALFCCWVLRQHWQEQKLFPLCSGREVLYLLGLIPIFLYQEVGHWLLGLSEKLPFLPLMIISVYCAVGVTYCWIYYYRVFLTQGRNKLKSL